MSYVLCITFHVVLQISSRCPSRGDLTSTLASLLPSNRSMAISGCAYCKAVISGVTPSKERHLIERILYRHAFANVFTEYALHI